MASLDARAVLLGLVTARLQIEFAYCKLVHSGWGGGFRAEAVNRRVFYYYFGFVLVWFDWKVKL